MGSVRVQPVKRNILPFLLALAVFTHAAWPSDWGPLLNDKALTDFNEDDLRDYLKVVNALLEAPSPSAPVEWSNPRTGAGARLEVIGQPHVEGFDECRRVRTNVYTRKYKPQTRMWTACRDGGGEWRLTKGT
jgi:surface antigen